MAAAAMATGAGHLLCADRGGKDDDRLRLYKFWGLGNYRMRRAGACSGGRGRDHSGFQVRRVIMKIAAFCLSWLLILTAHGALAQQTVAPNQSWDLLQQLQAGEKLEVERKTGKKKVSGKLVSLSDTELVIERKGKNERFSRDEVKNIWRVAPPSRRKRAIFSAIGGGVGAMFGVGIAVGLAFNQCGGSCADEKTGMAAAMIGLPVAGVLAGRALAGSGKRALIYSAP
jgi:hypothetical protein